MLFRSFIFVISLLIINPIRYSAPHSETILVTCATSELGQDICNHLAEKGYNLLIGGRTPEKLKSLASQLQERYPLHTIRSIILDFSKPDDIEAAVRAVQDIQLHGLVLIGPRPLALPKNGIPSTTQWEKSFLECFTTPLQVIRHLDQSLVNGGSIAIVSGLSSKYFMPAYKNTNVIRMMWTAETKNLADHFSSRGIRVNTVSPGVLYTGHHKQRIENEAQKNEITADAQLEKAVQGIPLKRYGQPKDLSNLLAFLLSPDSSFINGTDIPLDGGENQAY